MQKMTKQLIQKMIPIKFLLSRMQCYSKSRAYQKKLIYQKKKLYIYFSYKRSNIIRYKQQTVYNFQKLFKQHNILFKNLQLLRFSKISSIILFVFSFLLCLNDLNAKFISSVVHSTFFNKKSTSSQ